MLALKIFVKITYALEVERIARVLFCKYVLCGTYHQRSTLARPNTFVVKFDTSPQFYWLTNQLEERQAVRQPTV
jgi:hypothetical protein